MHCPAWDRGHVGLCVDTKTFHASSRFLFFCLYLDRPAPTRSRSLGFGDSVLVVVPEVESHLESAHITEAQVGALRRQDRPHLGVVQLVVVICEILFVCKRLNHLDALIVEKRSRRGTQLLQIGWDAASSRNPKRLNNLLPERRIWAQRTDCSQRPPE